jgi:hypothetical protein
MSEEKSVHFVLEVRDASPWSRGEVACAVKAFAMQVAVITEAVGGPTVFRARVRVRGLVCSGWTIVPIRPVLGLDKQMDRHGRRATNTRSLRARLNSLRQPCRD